MVVDLKHIIALAWLMGMMVSPEALVLHGNLAGSCGILFILPLSAALFIHGINTVADGEALPTEAPLSGEIQRLKHALGAFGATWLLLSARPAVAVCLATATLVTAGFVFNEIFVHWFPNFGFAVLVLLGLLAINLAGPRIASAAQLVFTLVALGGLVLLALAGLNGGGAAPPEPLFGTPVLDLSSWGLAAIALLGYDLLGYAPIEQDQRRTRSVMRIGIATAGLVFLAWNTVSLLYVEPSRLADTSIPHILTAKSVLGQQGRMIIGIVVIAGACAAVNLLLQSVARMSVAMAVIGLLPNFLGDKPSRPWPALVAMASLTGLLMAFGFAGSELLDVSLRAGLIMWLAGMGVNHLILTASCQDRKHREAKTRPCSGLLRHRMLFVTILSIAGVLVYTDDDPLILLKTLLALAVIAAGLASAGLIAARGSLCKPHNPSKLTKGALR